MRNLHARFIFDTMYYMAHDTVKAQNSRKVQSEQRQTVSVIGKNTEPQTLLKKQNSQTIPQNKSKVKSAGKNAPEVKKLAASKPKTNKADKKVASGVSVRNLKQAAVETEISPKAKTAKPKKDVQVEPSKLEVKQVKKTTAHSKSAKSKTVAPPDKSQTIQAKTKTVISQSGAGKTKEKPEPPVVTEKKVSVAKTVSKQSETKTPVSLTAVEKFEKRLREKAAREVERKKKSADKFIKPKQITLTEEIIETETLPNSVKPKKKKVKPIGAAVFRGKKNHYDFEVFDLGELFEQIPAVYIISKRITDKRKKGHHTLVCIGETNSVADEIKKHRKSKCLKKNHANVISILKEEDAQKRLKIETDLKAAHSIQCSLQ